MNLSSNIKDKISTIFGILAAIAGGLLTVGQNGVVLPPWATAVASSTVAISIAVIGYLTGKTPAANVKTPDQVVDQNKPEPIK